MKKIILVFSFALALVATLFFTQQKHSEFVVGVVVPMEHEALTQIINGFKEELEEKMDKPVTIKVMNAQGDSQIQRALIEQAVRKHYDLIVPIGTATSEMTLNLAKKQNVVCLAADEKLLSSSLGALATVLDDQLSVNDSFAFLHQAFPQLKKITLLYSSSEKVAKEIPVITEAAQRIGIHLQKLMIQNLAELYTMSQAIAPDSEAIFILKDHLIVSGIQTIVKQAEKRGILVMTSDEGSVISGSAFAIGIKESTIGRQGASIARDILIGTSPSSIPPQTINGPFPLFVNKEACIKQGIDFPKFIDQVSSMGIPIEYVNGEK